MNKKADSGELDYLKPKKWFLFDPRKLHEISQLARGKSLEESFDIIAEEMAKAYPGYISKNQKWIFNYAGGGMAQLRLLHASIREYVLFWGTCVGTEGHSGRYASEIFDFMLRGEMLCEYEGVFEPEVHLPGGRPAYLGSKVVKHYKIQGDGWMFEYCRGNIIKMLPFGMMDTIVSALDMRTVLRLLYNYGKLAVKVLFLKGKDLTLILSFILFAIIIAAVIVYFVPLVHG